MPDDNRSVIVGIRIRQPDGGDARMTHVGSLRRVETGWLLTSAATRDGEPEIELDIRSGGGGIRMKRRGEIGQEQEFRQGERTAGTIDTAYGAMGAAAHTRRLHHALGPAGGTVEWEYDYWITDVEMGRMTLTFDIREEDAQ